MPPSRRPLPLLLCMVHARRHMDLAQRHERRLLPSVGGNTAGLGIQRADGHVKPSFHIIELLCYHDDCACDFCHIRHAFVGHDDKVVKQQN